MKTPKLSIIIPVFNAEKYLQHCLESIISQSFDDWECLLIDDGSQDSSREICDGFAVRDKRFLVFNKQNGGPSAARNLGLERATGEWIYFCDADDEVLLDGLKIMVAETSEKVDLVNAGYTAMCEDGSHSRCVPQNPATIIDRNEMVHRLLIDSKYLYQGFLWCKLFRRATIESLHLRFKEDIYFNEDRLFTLCYLCHSRGKVFFMSSLVYRYIEHNEGAMGSLMSRYNPKFESDLQATLLMLEEVKKVGCPRTIVNEWCREAINSYNRICYLSQRSKCYDEEKFKDFKNQLMAAVGIRFYYLDKLFYQVPQRIIRKIARTVWRKF